MAWLLLTHLAALALFWYAPRFWAARDAAAFNVSPADDTFHGKFHRQRLTWRVAFLLLVALAASEPLWGHWWALLTSFLALAQLGAAYFFYDFNPRLNRARNLPYVGPYYVSPDPNAARFPDRWLWARAVAQWPGGDAAQQQASAALALERLTVQVLEVGVLLYLALAAATYFLQ